MNPALIFVSESLEDRLAAATRRGAREAMVRHARAGEEVIVQRGGQSMIVPATEVLAEMEAAEAAAAAKKLS